MDDDLRPDRGECRFHLEGRCLYEERLNPGYHAGHRCRVLDEWEQAYDEFLGRVEAFGLDASALGPLWSRQFGRLVRKQPSCAGVTFEAGGGSLCCPHLLEGLCLQVLPECKEKCRHFCRNDLP